MKTHPKNNQKSAKILTGGFLLITGALFVLTWPRLFDYTLFKVSTQCRNAVEGEEPESE
jgi:hypothetical protein